MSNPDGMAIARARIAEEKEKRTGFLDLGLLGLTEWPEGLWELGHLTGLNLGRGWRDDSEWHEADANFEPNIFNPVKADWTCFRSLRLLSVNGIKWHSLESIKAVGSLESLDCADTPVTTLEPLAGIPRLKFLNCAQTQVSSFEPLAALTAIESLNCCYTRVSNLEPLAGLSSLKYLQCSATLVNDLQPLAGLASVEFLYFDNNRVSNLEPLAGLTALQSLSFSETLVSSLKPLAGLVSLQSLYCPNTPLNSLEPLMRLVSLRSLDCYQTQVSSLEPLAGLVSLQSLCCFGTPVSNLAPVAGLTALQSLNCAFTKVGSLAPLAGLALLQSLDCSYTLVSSLEPLEGLSSLRSIHCSGTPVSSLPDALVWRNSVKELNLSETAIRHIPAEVLSKKYTDNCLHRLRAHLHDVHAGDALMPDVKVLVLGNGRIGKTQICNRLRGFPFMKDADSTHGITVTTTECGEDAVMRLWDFGGQDLYHGTHGLFMRSRAVFVLVWTPDSENSETHEHGGMTFRNRPLAWWLAYIRHAAGADCPVLVVQNQCDRPEDERLRPPVEDSALDAFPFKKLLHYSAQNDRLRGSLDEALHEAIRWQREKQGQARVGKGRLAVKERLDAMRNEDAKTDDVSQRRHRTISQESFRELCAECGGVSSPELLLDYLHESGVVFYRKGLFGDRIILDQAWALDAVYAVFNRRQCWQQLRDAKGRFRRPLLAALVWLQHSEEEQKLFLGMMVSCGICFIHSKGDERLGIEPEYVAPELLPDFADVALEVEAWWDDAVTCDESRVDLPFLHPGVMRGLVSRIGGEAGMKGVYWKDGVCLYERTTHSRARIEQVVSATPGTWSGSIVIRTQGGKSLDLAKLLLQWACEAASSAGCEVFDSGIKARRPRVADRPAESGTKPEPEAKPDFAIPPRTKTTYAVSYAWEDESKALVEQLCEDARVKHDVVILRDTGGLGFGESIAKFMQTLARQDRVFIFLSGKYLKSPFCMYELWQVWQNCKRDDGEFRKHIRVHRLPDAAMMTPLERARCATHWKRQLEELDALVKTEGAGILGEKDFASYKLMQDFASRVGDVLAVIADMLLPTTLEDLEKHGFEAPE